MKQGKEGRKYYNKGNYVLLKASRYGRMESKYEGAPVTPLSMLQIMQNIILGTIANVLRYDRNLEIYKYL